MIPVLTVGFRLEEASGKSQSKQYDIPDLENIQAAEECVDKLIALGIQEKPEICGHWIARDVNCVTDQNWPRNSLSEEWIRDNPGKHQHRKLTASAREKETSAPSMKLKIAIRTAAMISPPIKLNSGEI